MKNKRSPRPEWRRGWSPDAKGDELYIRKLQMLLSIARDHLDSLGYGGVKGYAPNSPLMSQIRDALKERP